MLRHITAIAIVAALSMIGHAQTSSAAEQAGAPSTVIVLDVSNSMWGQIEGRSKIEIARDVIADLIGRWNPSTQLGLVAYGHRRAGDCSDIETVIPVGPVDAQSFVKTVNGLVPRGKTPLTAAVRQAAEILNYRDVPATVVLVSDGIESCRADPCALAAELERAGVDFTAHVIGFDVAKVEDQAQLRCIADNTGGKFFSASTADELAAAMQTVSAGPTPPLITLEALAEPGGPPVTDPGLRWNVVSLDREDSILSDAAEARPELALEPGRYLARATLANAAGAVEFDVSETDIATHQVILQAAVSVSPPPEAEANTTISVPWQGPDNPGDYLAVAEPSASDSAFLTYVRTSKGNPATLRLPEAPGRYEVRYVDAKNSKVLAKAAITATGLTATLDVPEQVDASSGFEVIWQGPDEPGDFIAIVAPDAPEPAFDIFARTSDGNPAHLNAPDTPGDYEVRYVSARTQQALASEPLTVVTTVELEAPPTADAGSEVSVTWSGPDNQNDFITVVASGAEQGSYLYYAYTRQGTPSVVRMPDEPGQYELRYVAGRSKATLASLPITVNPVSASLEAPPTANAGSEVSVTWSGPDNQGDYVTVVAVGADEGSYLNYTYTRQGSPSVVRMPDKPGQYELRYVAGQSKATLASLPITVNPVSAALEAPPTASAGAEVSVTWIGPDNQGDYVTVVPVGADEGSYTNYAYTAQGSPASIRMPDEPGQYELRYIAGQSRTTLASLPITVNPVSASIEAPPTANAGSEVEVDWFGPDNKNDYITVVAAGAEEGSYLDYAYTRQGSPLQVRMPDEPGQYELRYVSGQSKKTLASMPITVTAVSALLEAPPSASAGAEVSVTWRGPDNKNDYITVVAAGAEEGSHTRYAYTRNGSPAKVRMPDEPGQYELRYVSGQSNTTLASMPITVSAVSAELTAPPTASAGSELSVDWTGPDNQGDFITVVDVGAEEGTHGTYVYTRNASPAKVRMPDEPGQYELRYVSGQSKSTLASMPITVSAISAELTAPPTASAGAEVSVDWIGPDNKNDYVTVVAAGAEEGSHTARVYTRRGAPSKVRMPDKPGQYELRYISGQSNTTLASMPITVNEVTATLNALPAVNADAPFQVAWTGPDTRNDFIAIVEVGAPDDKRLAYSFTRNGSPAKLKAPKEPGQYELRYVMGQSRRVLARLPIAVQ